MYNFFLQFFLELQHYILTTCAEGHSAKGEESKGTTSCDLSADKSHLPVRSIQLLRQRDEEFASLLGTAFDSVIEAFTSLVREMGESLVQFIVNSTKSHCYSYKQEK